MSPHWWLALDQGGHSSRAIVFDTQGELITQKSAAIHTLRDGEHIEHDPQQLVQSLRECLHGIHDELRDDVRRIAAAGLATQRSSIVCWQRDTGDALSPVISWQDRRQRNWLQTLQSNREFIESTTGLVLSPHYGASKLRWCLDHLPAVQQALQQQTLCMGSLSSYLLHALLHEQPNKVDPGNASRTQLWSPATHDWSPQLLHLFGIPREVLPQCVPTCHDYGQLRVGERLIPLRTCTGDQAAVPFASGALRYDTAYINLGTGAFVLAPLQHDMPDAAPLLRSVLWSDASHIDYALEGTVNGAASALTWYAEQTGHNTRTISENLDRQQIALLDVPLFINGVGGVGSPWWLPDLPSQFVPGHRDALPTPTASGTAHVAAILDSIAFLICANLELMRKRHPALTTLAVGGGLSRCRYLCEVLADLSGLPVTRLNEPELTAKGLTYLVAGHPGEWLSADNTQFPARQDINLHRRYQQWQALMPKLSRA